jgi:hypothetical protein
MLLSLSVLAADPDPYVIALKEKKFLKIPNGNEVLLSYHSHSENTLSKIRIYIRNNSKVLWDKTFVNEYDELWHQVHFIPIVKDKFLEDLNDDGFLEIGVANWNGGKAPCASSAIIFTLKEDSLHYLKKQQINTEFSRYVYPAKHEFKNPMYKDPLCRN